jgi:alkylation response protein AidB-like acyl-CoA dehydrogenase
LQRHSLSAPRGVDYESGIHNRSAVEQKLIETEADIEAAMLTLLRAAAMADAGDPNYVEASVAKAEGGDVARTGAERCLEQFSKHLISGDPP